MKIVKTFSQQTKRGPEVYVVSEDGKVYRVGKTYRSEIRVRGNKPYLDQESSLKYMEDFVV